MLASLAASKTARLIASCVCPVVGAGTLTMAVPKVRDAVHRATAPREYAAPKTRERLPAAEPLSIADVPCTVTGQGISGGYVEEPEIAFAPPQAPRNGGPPSIFGPPNDRITTPPGGPSGVPEPHAWLQLLVGFALVGGSIRLARREPSEEEMELFDRVEDLKKDVRR